MKNLILALLILAGTVHAQSLIVISGSKTASGGPVIAPVGTPSCTAISGFAGGYPISYTAHAAGDQIFITGSFLSSYVNGFSSVTDNGGSGGSTYAHPSGFPQSPTSGDRASDEWYTLSTHSGLTTITVNVSAYAIAEVCVQEYQNGVSIGATNKGETDASGNYSFSTTVSNSSSFVIASIVGDSAVPTASSGTIRVSGYSGGEMNALQDNTGSTSVAIAGTGGSSYMDYTAIELKNF